MAEENLINPETFDLLLSWLDRNREAAAEKYETIRRRLIRVFAGRGCFEAEELADATFDRVTQKLPHITETYVGDPALYFYGVADKIHLEWLRRQKQKSRFDAAEIVESDKSALEIEYECLEKCLKKLPEDQHYLIVEYYREEKRAKIENRRKLAENLGINSGAMQIKASRIRTHLKECLRGCIAEKSSM